MSLAKEVMKYNGIIVESDVQARMRLRQATTAVHEFGEVDQVGTLRDAMQKLQGARRTDVVFISHRFSSEEVNAFIKEAKNTKQGQDSAYVLLLQNKDQDGLSVAQSVMRGADGMLFEPYSVDQLMELTRLASQVRKERSGAREKMAMKLMLQEVMNQLDLVALLKSCDMELTRSIKKLHELCAFITKLDQEKLQIYYELIVDTLENAPPPKGAFQVTQYRGSSARVKKLMEKKILAELEARQKETTETSASNEKDASS